MKTPTILIAIPAALFVFGCSSKATFDNEWLVIKIDKIGQVSDFKKIAD